MAFDQQSGYFFRRVFIGASAEDYVVVNRHVTGHKNWSLDIILEINRNCPYIVTTMITTRVL